MDTILLTGFEPFGEQSVNASWLALETLHNTTLEVRGSRARLVCCQLPCVFGASADVLEAAIAAHQPTLVIAAGEAAGRAAIAVERVAINVIDARIPDNQQQQPIDDPICAEGPAAYFSTLPCKAIRQALQENGIPAYVSNTAGTYVCNFLMYRLLHHLARHAPDVRGGFIHVPAAPVQCTLTPIQPSMCSEATARALRLAAQVSLDTRTDIIQPGGSIC